MQLFNLEILKCELIFFDYAAKQDYYYLCIEALHCAVKPNLHYLRGQGEKFWPSLQPLGTSGRQIGTRTGAGFTSTLVQNFFGRRPWPHGHRRQHMSVLLLSLSIHGLRPRKLYTSVAVTLVPARVPTQRPLVLSFTTVVDQAENFSPCPRI